MESLKNLRINLTCEPVYFSDDLPKIEAINPKNTAAAIPPDEAVNPPVKMPIIPSLAIASLTPFARVFPNPTKGTLAPAPAKSINLS